MSHHFCSAWLLGGRQVRMLLFFSPAGGVGKGGGVGASQRISGEGGIRHASRMVFAPGSHTHTCSKLLTRHFGSSHLQTRQGLACATASRGVDPGRFQVGLGVHVRARPPVLDSGASGESCLSRSAPRAGSPSGETDRLRASCARRVGGLAA